MNTRRTSTDSDSLAGSRTTRRTSRRTNKLVLLRAKVATIVTAVVLFFATLTGIAIYNPQVGDEAAVPVQAQQITIVEPSGSNSVLPTPPPRRAAVRPLVRSRGS